MSQLYLQYSYSSMTIVSVLCDFVHVCMMVFFNLPAVSLPCVHELYLDQLASVDYICFLLIFLIVAFLSLIYSCFVCQQPLSKKGF